MRIYNRMLYPMVVMAIAFLGIGATVIDVRAADSTPAAVTIFVSKGTSGKGLADALNKEHAEWYAKGYAFVAMDSYIEDGDLQGMWVTYAKKP